MVVSVPVGLPLRHGTRRAAALVDLDRLPAQGRSRPAQRHRGAAEPGRPAVTRAARWSQRTRSGPGAARIRRRAAIRHAGPARQVCRIRQTGRPAGRWKVASAGPHGPVANGCALCAAARTGRDAMVVRYAAPWHRVCARHQRWMLTAGDGHRHHHLDLRAAPEVAAAQRAWPKVARQAVAAGADPGRVFALAHAVVCAWWEQALEWEHERIWPARLHAVAGGDAGPRFWWWRVIARDAVVFPETVALARVLLDPGMQERIWDDHGSGGPVRPFRPDGTFFRELAVRLGRPWLADVGQTPQRGLVLGGPLHAGPLLDCMGAFTRIRRGQQDPNGYGLDPWWLRADHRPASARVQLRALAEASAVRKGGSAGGVGPGLGGAPTVRRLYRDRNGRAAAAYTAAPPPPG